MSPLETIERIAERGGEDVLQQVVDVLHDEVDHYSWVGIYLVEGDDLVLGPWRGPAGDRARADPGRPGRLRRGRRERRDRDRRRRQRRPALPRLLSLDPLGDRRADRHEGRVVGEIDIDSDRPAAFGEDDREFLERVAMVVAPLL